MVIVMVVMKILVLCMLLGKMDADINECEIAYGITLLLGQLHVVFVVVVVDACRFSNLNLRPQTSTSSHRKLRPDQHGTLYKTSLRRYDRDECPDDLPRR